MRWLLVPLLFCACSRDEDSYALKHFPELERVDPTLERGFRQLMEDGSPRAIAERTDAEGAPGGWALLKILADEFSDEVLVAPIAAPERDPLREAAALNMGRIADDELKRLLLRGLANRQLHPLLRRKLVIALCRRGNPQAPLVDVALERGEHPELRRSILARLHRLREPPSPRLHEALQAPFEGLDRVAAAALARMGSPEAPSLVLAALQDEPDLLIRHYVAAGNRITGADLPLPKGVVEANEIRPHIESLRDWITEHPPQTDFERARQAYLDGPRRRREMKLTSLRDILAAGEDFDLASAILLLTAPERRYEQLEALDRLARHLQSRPGDMLDHWLYPDHSGTAPHATLSDVLRRDAGNPLAYATLFLAVAERRDLPLFDPAPRFVRSRSKREVLASVLDQEAARRIHAGQHAEARGILTNALRLAPDHLSARRNRAVAAFHSDLGADEAVLEDLDQLAPDDLTAGRLFLELGEIERARQVFDRAGPSDDATAGKVLCAAYLESDEFSTDALHELRGSKTEVLRLAATEALIRLRPAAPREAMEWTDGSLATHLRVAAVLLDVDPPRAEDALTLLGQAQPRLQKQLRRARETIYRIADPAIPGRAERDFLVLKAKALALLDRRDEARAVLREAEQVWGTTRRLLQVRRALRS